MVWLCQGQREHMDSKVQMCFYSQPHISESFLETAGDQKFHISLQGSSVKTIRCVSISHYSWIMGSKKTLVVLL